MKNTLLNKAVVSLVVLASLSACTKQRIYTFDEENKQGDWTVLATIDDENQKIVIDCKSKKEEVHAGFFFWFYFDFVNENGQQESISSKINLTNQFQYKLDDGAELEFDENGYYEFHKTTKINVWYNYADREVKNAIINRNFSCEFGCGHYEPVKANK